MSRRARRIKSPHPGVVLRSRTWTSGEVTWFARFADPDTGKLLDVNLTKLGKTTHDSRVTWAKERSRANVKRLAERASGAPEVRETTIADAVQSYVDVHVKGCKGETVYNYTAAAERFRGWCVAQGVRLSEDLAPQHLNDYRNHLMTAAPRRPSKGRVWREVEGARCKPEAINTALRRTSVMLHWLRCAGRTPKLTRDAISDAMKRKAVPRDPPRPFSPAELQQLLRAALRHDAARFKETTEERREGVHAPKGTTPRHPPAAALLLFVLLTGARIGEVAQLAWSDVDLDAIDTSGATVGSARVWASTTKHGHGRLITLGHAPILRHLLLAMKLKAGDQALVFPGWGSQVPTWASKRLTEKYGAPRFSWSAKSGSKDGTLRSTTECYLASSPAIFGSGSVWAAAALLGHDVATARHHYLSVMPGLDPAAKTLERAMKVEDLARAIVATVSGEELEDDQAEQGAAG